MTKNNQQPIILTVYDIQDDQYLVQDIWRDLKFMSEIGLGFDWEVLLGSVNSGK